MSKYQAKTFSPSQEVNCDFILFLPLQQTPGGFVCHYDISWWQRVRALIETTNTTAFKQTPFRQKEASIHSLTITNNIHLYIFWQKKKSEKIQVLGKESDACPSISANHNSYAFREWKTWSALKKNSLKIVCKSRGSID